MPPISCSSTLTKSGIKRGFSPLFLAAALEVAGMVLLVAPALVKGRRMRLFLLSF